MWFYRWATKKLLPVSKPGSINDNNQEIDWIFISFWNILHSIHLKKGDESNAIRIFHLWMLLKTWIQEKLPDILILCYLTPDTNQATCETICDN